MHRVSPVWILLPLVLIACGLLATIPFVFRSPPRNAIAMAAISGLVLAMPTGLILITMAHGGHWWTRIAWLIAITTLGVGIGAAASSGVETLDPVVAAICTIATTLCGVIALGTRELLQGVAGRVPRLRLPSPQKGPAKLTLASLMGGTGLLACTLAVHARLLRDAQFNPGVFGALLGSSLLVLVATLNASICLSWAFARRDMVWMYVWLGPLYAVAVVGFELQIMMIVLGAPTNAEAMGLTTVATFVQCTTIMFCLLYLRACGYRWVRGRSAYGRDRMSDKKSNPTFRILLIVGLLVAVGLKAFDLRARGQATETFERVSAKLEEGVSMTDAEVHELLGPPSDGYAPAEKKWIDRYSYRGTFKRFDVLVKYSDTAARLLEGVEME